MNEKTMPVIIGCGILRNEVRRLVEKNRWDARTLFLDSSLHIDFDKLKSKLEAAVNKFPDREKVIIYGTCHPFMDTMLPGKKADRIDAQNCIEMLLGKETFTLELTRGAFFIMEDWARRWEAITSAAFGDNKEGIKLIFRSEHKYFLAIKTPCSGDFTRQAEKIAADIGLPLKWKTVSLDILEQSLAALLKKQAPKAEEPPPPALEALTREHASLKKDLNNLLSRNAQLESIMYLYDEIVREPLLENLTTRLPNIIMEVYGGQNVAIYYKVEGEWFYRDIYGEDRNVDIEAEEPVFAAVSGEQFIHQVRPNAVPVLGAAVPDALGDMHVCIFPLLLNRGVIGVIVLDGMLVYDEGVINELQIFFKHFALTLYNAIASYTRLQEAYSQLDQIFSGNPDGMMFLDTEMTVRRINKSFLDLLGKKAADCIGGKCYDAIQCCEPDRKLCKKNMRDNKADRIEGEVGIRHISGSVTFCISSRQQLKSKTGDPLGFVVNVKDITGRKNAEEKLKLSLKEKEIMLKEIHHRVKNNLQIVYSLLKMKAHFLKDKESGKSLEETALRVRTMGLIHERLYQSEDLAEIDINGYIDALKQEVLRLYRHPGIVIQNLTAAGPKLSLTIEQAIPCGLVLNELLCNALEHAFPQDREGVVTVSFSSGGSGLYTLAVRDNGIGISEDTDLFDSGTLGMKLVKGLVGQLGGKLELDKSAGLGYTITFKHKEQTE